MKRERHGPEQIIAKLREADGMLSAESAIALAPSTGPASTSGEDTHPVTGPH